MLTHSALLHLKATQMNIQLSLVRELMLYEFRLGHNDVEATKNICCVKSEGMVHYNRVTRWFKKFCLGCKNLNDQARSERPKTMESEVVLQAIKPNLVISIQRVSSKLNISQSSMVNHKYHLMMRLLF